MTELRYDLIVRGGRVIDPGNGLESDLDIGVCEGRIAALAPTLEGTQSTEVIDASGHLVVPGLIDTHAHVYQHVSGRFGLNPDLVGVKSGVTTVVDQGGASCMTFPGFRHFIAEPAETRVLAFVSLYVVGGLEGHYYPELYGPSGIDVAACARTAEANPDLIKGIKAHAEVGGISRWGMAALEKAREAGDATGLPIYFHLGQLWPERAGEEGRVDIKARMADIVGLMREGDFLAHPFTRHPGGFVDEEGGVHPVIEDALARGVLVDVGHGSHFSFKMAERALAQGIRPFTLGADMHGYNTHVPPEQGTPDAHPDDEMHLFAGQTRFSLCHAMTELLAMGLELSEILAMATSNAARMIGMSNTLGHLSVGHIADISILRLEKGSWSLRDNSGDTWPAKERLVPVGCLKDGCYHAADSVLLPG